MPIMGTLGRRPLVPLLLGDQAALDADLAPPGILFPPAATPGELVHAGSASDRARAPRAGGCTIETDFSRCSVMKEMS